MFSDRKIQEVQVKIPTPYEDNNLYKEKYEKLKHNVEMFLDPDLLNIEKIKVGTIFDGGDKDELKKMIILNLDTIVDNLCAEKELASKLESNCARIGENYDYSMYIVIKPEDKKRKD